MKAFQYILYACFIAIISVTPLRAANYVNTQGEPITEEQIGDYCRPTELLSNGAVMVFAKTESDLSFYAERLQTNGVSDQAERTRMVQAASSDDCERKAGNKCSEGKCSSGSCKQKSTGGITSCSCQ